MLTALVQAMTGRTINVKGTAIPFANMHELLDRWKGWVYACVMRRAHAVTATPLRLYTMKPRGAKVYEFWEPKSLTPSQAKWLVGSSESSVKQALASSGELLELGRHPLLDTFWNCNPVSDGLELLEYMCISLDLVGNGYWLYRFNEMGLPYELWPLQPQRVRICVSRDKPVDHYEYILGAQPLSWEPNEVVHFKYPSPLDPLYGFSPLQAATAAAILEDLIMRYNKALLENDARPDMVLEVPNALTDDE